MRIAAKDIPDDVFLGAVEAEQRATGKEIGVRFKPSTGNYDGAPWAMCWRVHDRVNEAMGFAVPWKVVLAKYRQLEKRKLVDGCGCGCRGDWQVRK